MAFLKDERIIESVLQRGLIGERTTRNQATVVAGGTPSSTDASAAAADTRRVKKERLQRCLGRVTISWFFNARTTISSDKCTSAAGTQLRATEGEHTRLRGIARPAASQGSSSHLRTTTSR